jgi:hypothetical protein
MSTSIFIEQLAAGQAADAKETLSNLLSARAFEALDTRKQELASTLFGGQVEEEVEQIDELTGKGKLPAIAAYHKEKSAEAKDKMEKVRATNTKLPVPKSTSAKIFAKDYESKYHSTQAKRAAALMKKEEVEELDEGTMTGITLGQKVKNKQGGYNQDVHHKGEKIGHIEAYKHRTGMRYGSHHDASGDGSAGNRSPEESIDDIRYSHAEHLKDNRVKK